MRIVAIVVLITNVNLLALSTWYIATHENTDLGDCNTTRAPIINMTEVWDVEEEDVPKGGVPMEYDVQGPFLFRNEQLNQTATAFVPGERVWAIMLLRDAPPDTRLRLLEAWACTPSNHNSGMPLPYSHTHPLQTGCYTPSLNIEENGESGFDNGHRWKVWHAQAALTPSMRTEFGSRVVAESHPTFAKMKGMFGAGLSFLVDPLVSSGSHVSQAAPIFLVITWTVELRLTQMASFEVSTKKELFVAKNHSYVTFYKIDSGLVPISILMH